MRGWAGVPILRGHLNAMGAGEGVLPQLIEADGDDNNHADDDLLHERGPTHLVGAIAQDRHG